MFIRFVKLMCVGLWIAGFVLLVMSYQTNRETDRLSNEVTVLANGTKIWGRNRETGERTPKVIASEYKARRELIGGISAIMSGALIGLVASIWGHKRPRRRKGSRGEMKSDHLASQFHRSRSSSPRQS